MKKNTVLRVGLVLSIGYLLIANVLADSGRFRSSMKSIYGYRSDVYHVRFYRGYRARVAIAGNGNSNLDMYIYDQYGRLVCYDSSSRDRFVCKWTPHRTGKFKIVVKNRGRYRNRYAIATN